LFALAIFQPPPIIRHEILAKRRIARDGEGGARVGGAFGLSLIAGDRPSSMRRLSLTQLNLVVWAKTNGGMGSLYRSHELPRAAGLGRSVSGRLELRWDPSKAKGG
jgi:hypothetical protein